MIENAGLVSVEKSSINENVLSIDCFLHSFRKSSTVWLKAFTLIWSLSLTNIASTLPSYVTSNHSYVKCVFLSIITISHSFLLRQVSLPTFKRNAFESFKVSSFSSHHNTSLVERTFYVIINNKRLTTKRLLHDSNGNYN